MSETAPLSTRGSLAIWVWPFAAPASSGLTIGPLVLSANGAVPGATAALPLGALSLTAVGIPSDPLALPGLVLGPLRVSAFGLFTNPVAPTGCNRSAWLTLGDLSVPLEDVSAGYFCTSLDLGFPDVREVVSPRADRDGTFDRTTLFGGRAVTANISALKGAGAQVDAVATAFAPFMRPSVRPILHYVLDRPGTPERTLTLRAAGYSWPVAGPWQRDIQLSWVASDPIAYDPNVRAVAAWAGSEGGRTYNLTPNRIYVGAGMPAISGRLAPLGDVPVRPLLRIFGPITAPRVTLDPDDGPPWHFNFLSSFILDAGTWVDVDTDARTVLINSDPAQPALMSVDWTRSSWQWLEPAPVVTILSLIGASTTDASQVQAIWQDGYLS